MSEAQGVTVEVVTDLEDGPPVRGTREGMYDILVNLIFNAVDAMPEGGKITISTTPGQKGVVLSVNDTGVGMDEETRRRMFEPFFTVKADVGSGLGLSAVHGLVTRWGGTVDVESAPGQGTTVVLSLPAWTGAMNLKEAETAGRRRQGNRILVVDDDERVCRILFYVLSDYYEVDTAGGGQAALAQFEPGRYQAALVDLGMPGMPGDLLVQKIREEDPLIATILVTGFPLAPDDPRRKAFDFSLQKPFNALNDVQDVVTQAIALYEMRTAKGE